MTGTAASRRSGVRVNGVLLSLTTLLLACSGPDRSSPHGTVSDTATVTWTEDIQPVIAVSCSGCHSDGGLAPIALDDYTTAAKWVEPMAASVASGEMPPFLADPESCQPLQSAPTVPDSFADTLRAWDAAGTPYGPDLEPVLAPEPPSLEGIATETFTIPYTPDHSAGDDWRCFVVEPDFSETHYLKAYQVIPEDPAQVHHVTMFQPLSEKSADIARALDDGSGYTCFGDAGIPAGLVSVWSPGNTVYRIPDERGIPIQTGMPIIVQIHYPVTGGSDQERTQVLLESSADGKPVYPIWMLNSDFALPPGEPSVSDPHSSTIDAMLSEMGWEPQPVDLIGGAMHMHLMGLSTRASITDSRGTDRCAIDIPQWDYNWHNIYFFEEPMPVDADATVDLDCSWDTTAATQTTVWGDNVEQEMCVLLLLAAPQDD